MTPSPPTHFYYQDYDGKSALSYAIKQSDNRIALALLGAGAESYIDGNSLLFDAITLNQDAEVVHAMLNHGASVNCIDVNGRSPLHAVSMNVYLDCMKNIELLKPILSFGADVRLLDGSQKNALHLTLEPLPPHRLSSMSHPYMHPTPGLLPSTENKANYVAFLYIAGIPLSEKIIENIYIYKSQSLIPQFVLDDQGAMLPLTNVCRKYICTHLLDPEGGNHNNLIQATSRLPVPKPVKQFLFFMENVSDSEEISPVIADFLDSLI